MHRAASLVLLLLAPAVAQQASSSLGRLFEASDEHMPQEWVRVLEAQMNSNKDNKDDGKSGSFDWSGASGSPTIPAIPEIPAIPTIPAIPAIPSPGAGIPAIPAIPAVPAIPAIPAIPSHASGGNGGNGNGRPGRRMLQQANERDGLDLNWPSLGSFDWNPAAIPTPPPLPDIDWVLRCVLLGSEQLAMEDPLAVAANVQALLQSLAGFAGQISVDLSSLAPSNQRLLRGSSAKAVTLKDLPATDLPCSSASTPVYLAILGTGAIDPLAAMRAIEDNSFASVFTQPADFCATKFIQFQPVPFASRR